MGYFMIGVIPNTCKVTTYLGIGVNGAGGGRAGRRTVNSGYRRTATWFHGISGYRAIFIRSGLTRTAKSVRRRVIPASCNHNHVTELPDAYPTSAGVEVERSTHSGIRDAETKEIRCACSKNKL
ncbi:jg4668 [Pararge aegeria aegeria]|uniref:Jg4668 protein n=1 Tax=Pararge aegeria aegeria TaxID=348720 RepID=A0A8S4S2H3_9NEOP|nr:jg4668 [Pararge aegeria aegeria]